MRTRSSSIIPVVSSNPSTSKRRNRRRSQQPFILEKSPVDTMADQRTMAELQRAPTEGYEEAIMVLSILVEQFELKHSLINMMTLDQFFGLEKDNPHDHIRWGSPPVAWDRYKDLLRACPHHGFTEFHQLDTFYNALNPADQDSLNATGGNLLERRTQDVLTIIENKSKCLSSGGNTFPELRDNIQVYVSAVAINYNQGNLGFRPIGSGSLPSNTVAYPKGKLKSITTHSRLVIDGTTIPTPTQSINLKVDERVEETFTNPDLTEYTIKVPPPPLHINITLADALILMPRYEEILKVLLSNKEKLQELANTSLNENCSAVILKKLPKKLGDSGKFLISCGFSELKCKALADLGASINLMPLSFWKKLGLPELISTRMTLELANRAICTPAGITRDVFVPVGKFIFPADFVIVDYESDLRVSLILGRPFLRTARALINVHGEEMILRDEGSNVLSEKLLDLDSTKVLHPPLHDDTLIRYRVLLKEIEFMLYQDIDSSLKDSINLANHVNNVVNSVPEMFTDKHALDYSSPLIFDEYDDDFLEIEFDAENVYDAPFDSKREKIIESKLLIDKLDFLCDCFLSEYDAFISQDFSSIHGNLMTNTEGSYPPSLHFLSFN
uniref:Reverse transcriptase domain-containing protein n=1 Tax=Tanacetum cinerariifolium TaxID=118510 RepID=A0A6L2J8L1_TANCI|nr:reverse transcriptase domain-containing protein [Tanacetum cinerariifolium]